MVALALSALSLLWRFSVEPFEYGYTRYAGLAAEMLRSGDWVVMRAGGHLYLSKPPLYVWLIAAPMALLGRTSSFAQHVPDVLAIGFSLGFTWAFARHWFGGRSAGPCAALVLATSVGFAFLARGKRIDPLFTAWLTGSLYFAWRAFEASVSRRERICATLGSYLLLVLAVLTKGPLALALYALVIVPYAIWQRRIRQLASREGLGGLALLLVGVGIWPALVIRELGFAEVLAHLSEVQISRLGSPLYYAGQLPYHLLPWSAFLPALVLSLWAARPLRGSTPPTSLAFALCWVAGVLLPLQFSHHKHYRYALPVFPVFALGVVALWHSRAAAGLRASGGAWGHWLATVPLLLLLVAAAIAAVGVPFALALHPEWLEFAPCVAPPLAGAGLVGFLGLRRFVRTRDARCTLERALVAVSLAFVAADGAFTRFAANPERHAAVLAAFVPVMRGEPALGYRLGLGAWSRVLLVSGIGVESCSSAKEAISWLHAVPGGEGWILTSRKASGRILRNPGFAVGGEPIERAGVTLIRVSDPARAQPPARLDQPAP